MSTTSDIAFECRHLQALGAGFRGESTSTGPITAILFEDTCGTLINPVQPAV